MSQYTKWIGGLAEWTQDPPAGPARACLSEYARSQALAGGAAQAGNTAYISVVFTWQLAEAYQRAAWYKALGYHVRAGGAGRDPQPSLPVCRSTGRSRRRRRNW